MQDEAFAGLVMNVFMPIKPDNSAITGTAPIIFMGFFLKSNYYILKTVA